MHKRERTAGDLGVTGRSQRGAAVSAPPRRLDENQALGRHEKGIAAQKLPV